ncbi:hypothetical protein [Halomonas sp. LBP4]|uniref:hypothetical protein n=1 Tax=Halomonas sp. LBP4 TaxID=2044917 RepID=UPI0011B7FA02|nr:hypothetical protein [Halomonas sp. LBP4]
MRDAEWSPYPPDVDAIRAAGNHAYYWVRGWNFSKPVVAEVELITRNDPLEHSVIVRRIGDQLLEEPARSPRFTNLELLPNWLPLEWSGPIANLQYLPSMVPTARGPIEELPRRTGGAS